MNTKQILVSILAIAAVMYLAAGVSAAQITTDYTVKVNGEVATSATYTVSVVENDRINVEISFTSLVNDTDVTVEAVLNGRKGDTSAETSFFDIESGNRYTKTLSIQVPAGLKEVSDDLVLEMEISGKDHRTVLPDITLNVQRESYSLQILSVSTGTIKAGMSVPVDVVIKNVGYNSLDDTYVTAKIPALGLSRTVYLGDLVAIEDKSEDDTDTVSGRLYLEIPYSAKAGAYALEVVASNGDTQTSGVASVTILNDFSAGNVIVSGDSILIVNPTNDVVVYRLVPEPSTDLAVSISQSVVAVPAGSSRTVDVSVTGSNEGTYNYKVDVFSMNGELVSTASLTKTVESSGTSGTVIVLTVILAIIFVVLLVVLIVLMGKKPQKSEDFGESYY